MSAGSTLPLRLCRKTSIDHFTHQGARGRLAGARASHRPGPDRHAADLFLMALNDILAPGAVFPTLKVSSKKQALQELAAHAAELLKRDEREIFETLNQRERLGSTGVGSGIAIPHGKLAGLDQLFGMFARLEKPIDFEALDGEPVDLIFLLLAPEAAGADHLKALARVARLLRDAEVARKLRNSHDVGAIYEVLTGVKAADTV